MKCPHCGREYHGDPTVSEVSGRSRAPFVFHYSYICRGCYEHWVIDENGDLIKEREADGKQREEAGHTESGVC